MTRLVLSALLICGICIGGEPDNAKSWKHPEPITYDSLKGWHAQGGLKDYPWRREWHLDLNQDDAAEVFLGIEGYSRGMSYALFTQTDSGWRLLGELVEGSNRPFEVLPDEHDGWHDFLSVLPSGRGGVFEFVYTWNGKNYVEKSEREVTPKEFSHE